MAVKATLEFGDIIFDDKDAFNDAVHGAEWKYIVCDLDQRLRCDIKYGHKYETADDALNSIRVWLGEELIARDLSID